MIMRSLDTIILHGDNKHTPIHQLVGRYDVVITNYHTVSRNYRIYNGTGPGKLQMTQHRMSIVHLHTQI